MAVASLTDEDIKMIHSLARDEKIGDRVSELINRQTDNYTGFLDRYIVDGWMNGLMHVHVLHINEAIMYIYMSSIHAYVYMYSICH